MATDVSALQMLPGEEVGLGNNKPETCTITCTWTCVLTSF